MHMQEQNFKNHSRYVLGWHVVTGIAIIAFFVGSFFNVDSAAPENLYSASLLCLNGAILILIFWYARAFALKAQDRAIRAEEQFRHFILTGKPLPTGLRLGQIVALRFASDAEFPALAKKAVEQQLSSKEIKASILQWKADHNRV